MVACVHIEFINLLNTFLLTGSYKGCSVFRDIVSMICLKFSSGKKCTWRQFASNHFNSCLLDKNADTNKMYYNILV